MNRLLGLFLLARPFNTLLCAVSVICGGIIVGKPLDTVTALFTDGDTGIIVLSSIRLFSAALSASFILAAGNALNDVCDVANDSINAPHRPLPSGLVTVPVAGVFAAVSAVAGLLLSIPLGLPGMLVAVSAVLLLGSYDCALRSAPIAGNTVVSFMGGLAFVFGGIAGGSPERALVPAGFAFLLHFARELVKDAADFKGDRVANIETAATAWGVAKTGKIAAGALLVLIAATALPFFTGAFGPVYMAIIVIGVWPAAVYGIVIPFVDPTTERMAGVARFLKIAMPFGILAVLAGFQGW